MDVKSFIKKTAEKEKQNHKIINIMMVALFSAVIFFTLFFGVNVDIGSAVYGDTNEFYVRQNLFQIIDTAGSVTMSKEDAEYYVSIVNEELENKYGVQGVNYYVIPAEDEKDQGGAFEHLKEFNRVAEQLGDNAPKVNLLKYKLAFAIAIGNMDLIEHRQSIEGSRTVATSGQLLLVMLPQLAFLIISTVFLILSILALIHKKSNKRDKFSLMLLMICCFANIILFSTMGFMCMNWAGILVITLVFLCVVCYALIRHAMMDKHDFSLSMLIHNGALLLGTLLAFILFLSPIFKMTNTNGNSINLGWSYLMDYVLTENAYMSAVIAYTLTEVLMIVLLMMPSIILTILMLMTTGKFITADYQHNEKKILLIIAAAVNFLIFLILMVLSGGGGLNITSMYATVKLRIGFVITELLVLAGLIVFEYLYKVKPIKKEIVIN